MSKRRVRWREGDVVQIDLGDGVLAFGRLLKLPLIAFHDLRAGQVPKVDEILKTPILFKIWVMKYAIADGDWPVIGHEPLQADLLISPTFCKQDAISKKLTLYHDGKETPATFEQCKGLEKAAVWDPEHVVERLRDHYAGRPNKWVESLRLKGV